MTVLRQRCAFSDAEVFVYVYKDDDNFVTSGAMLLSGLDLQETYRAIDSVATGRIPSLFCVFAITRDLPSSPYLGFASTS